MLPHTPENGVWHRLIPIGYLTTALSSAHTKVARSRFSAGSLLASTDEFAALYFADDPVVAQFEIGAVLGSLAPGGHVANPRKNFFTLNVRIILSGVFDLTEVTTAQIPLATTAQELTGDWNGYQIRSYLAAVSAPTGIAPTQELGMALFKTGVEGFRSVSGRIPYHQTLTGFTDNLRHGSSLTFADSTGIVVHKIAP
jgi:hypothetical protein